jgi:asparagine synthase (glutamine-hydrolysing)
VRTYGIRFDNAAYDEGTHQDEMVRLLGVNHREIRVTDSMVAEQLVHVVRHAETPLLRTSPVPLYLLSGMVHDDGIKVVLTGEGADEVFGGYNIFRENKVRRFWAREPDSASRGRLVERLYPYLFKNPRMGSMLATFFRRGLGETDDPLYSHLPRWRTTERSKFYLSPDFRAGLGGFDCLSHIRSLLPDGFGRTDPLSQAQYLEMKLFMANYLLSSQGDRVAMAHSLEIRVPFLDHRIIEYMAGVKPKWKIRGLNEKYILKKALSTVLPDTITQRPKHPFRAPVSPQHLIAANRGILSGADTDASGVLNRANVERFTEKLSGLSQCSETDSMALTGILTVLHLHRLFLAEKPAALPVSRENCGAWFDYRTDKDER